MVIYLFWGDGCPHCETAKPVIRDLAQRQAVELREYEVWYNPENNTLFVNMAQLLGFEPQYVPTIMIADRYWEGFSESTLAEMEAVVAACLQTGCPDAGAGMAAAEPVVSVPSGQEAVSAPSGQEAVTAPAQPAAAVQSNGFAVANFTLLGMAAALVYSGVYLRRGLSGRRSRRVASPRRVASTNGNGRNAAMLVLSLAGLGVAGYLAYVETQAVPAVCGPVGDCNAVQSSPYALLFGFLPVGVLGVVGYLAILAAWFYPSLRRDRYRAYMPVVVLGLTFAGVLFSLYLTFLEPYVIQAVCMWCITSAVIMTLLLLLSLKPGLQAIQALRK